MRRGFQLFIFTVIGAASVGTWKYLSPRVERGQDGLMAFKKPVISKEQISHALAAFGQNDSLPTDIDIEVEKISHRVPVTYSLDEGAQSQIEKLIKSYSPDFGAFVALDATSGRVLSLVSFTKNPSDLGNLALKAIFPAASVFKVVTATAAVDQNKITPDTVIAFNGANHTLYRRNVAQTSINRWTRYMTVREAFAKSVNTVFGKLGLFFLDPFKLEEYAHRFKFNEDIPGDFPVERGTIMLNGNDKWSIAEVASGFTRGSQMSPLQGALMAASVANDGVMMEPYIVNAFSSPDGAFDYKVEPKRTSVTMTPASAQKIRALMRETVRNGTSRKSFRDLLKKRSFADLEIGGKSGSLMGLHPRGKCDWFVGYAISGDHKIALAALTINEKQWRVKSSYIARKFIEAYFSPASKASRQVSSNHD